MMLGRATRRILLHPISARGLLSPTAAPAAPTAVPAAPAAPAPAAAVFAPLVDRPTFSGGGGGTGAASCLRATGARLSATTTWAAAALLGHFASRGLHPSFCGAGAAGTTGAGGVGVDVDVAGVADAGFVFLGKNSRRPKKANHGARPCSHWGRKKCRSPKKYRWTRKRWMGDVSGGKKTAQS